MAQLHCTLQQPVRAYLKSTKIINIIVHVQEKSLHMCAHMCTETLQHARQDTRLWPNQVDLKPTMLASSVHVVVDMHMHTQLAHVHTNETRKQMYNGEYMKPCK